MPKPMMGKRKRLPTIDVSWERRDAEDGDDDCRQCGEALAGFVDSTIWNRTIIETRDGQIFCSRECLLQYHGANKAQA